AAAAARVAVISTLSVKVGNLLHETQRERGRTSQFVSSKGAKFGPELRAQQALTDQRLAEYRQFLAAEAGELPAVLRSSIDRNATALDKIPQLRSQAS